MEFPFSVNELLPDAITVVDEKLAPFRSKVISDRYELGHKQQQLKQVIDAMGEASGRAQNLRGAITSAMKLQCSDHKLYVMKDGAANCGKGAVVGILKTGYKKLFLLDLRQVQNEVNPLCVLDFYVHESKQRMGYGKSLFQHMLKVENVHPAQVAIDRPSVKFISFLKKHYDLKNVIPQVNNFVVFDEFFRNLQAVSHVSKGGQRLTGGGPGGNHGRPPIHPYRRNSQQGSDHRWGGRTRPTRDNSRLSSARPGSREVYVLAKSTPGMPPQSSDEALKNIALPPLVSRTPSLHSRPGSQEAVSGRRRNSLTELVNTECIVDRGMAARATCYSRHSLSRGNSAPNKIRAKQTTSDVMDISLNGPVPGSSSLLAISSENSGGNITPESTSTVEILRGTGSGRTFSGGRRRNLHLTSSDNILGVGPISTQYRFPNTRENKIEQADTNSKNASSSADTTQNHDYMSPSGNYSINSVYNAHFGPEKGTGLSTSWNVLGVPSYVGQQTPKHPYYTQNKPQPRTFPF